MKKFLFTFFVLIVIFLMGSIVFASTVIISADELNIRENASTESNAIGLLKNGESVEVIAEEGEWYKINYQEKVGYINKKYTKEETKKENEKISNDVEVNQNTKDEMVIMSDANLYALPLVNSTKITTLKKDTKVTMVSNNGKWLFVQTDTDSGWIISSKTMTQAKTDTENKNEKNDTNTISNTVTNTLENNESENTVKENNQTNTTENDEISDTGEYPVTMYVNTDSVYVRKGPSTSADIIAGSVQGADLEVIGKEGEWYKVNTQDGIGYIKSEFLSKNK